MENQKPVLLIVDDEPAIINSIIRQLEDDYTCLGAPNASLAKHFFADHKIACVLSDQRMPGESGSEFLAWVREHYPDTVRVLITGYSDFDSVVSAVNQGQIYQFLNKPWEPVQLEAVVRQAVRIFSLVEENKLLQQELKNRNHILERENLLLKFETISNGEPLSKLVGISSSMQNLKNKIMHFLVSQSTVLVTGESGTGKELVAHALHFGGPRKDKPFVAQNCAALTDSLLESELFGHVKGSFTHATENRIGIIESAQGGTLFLDEVGDMSLTLQAKLLRFLQEGVVQPIGSRVEKHVDVRIIAATHRDLESMVQDKTFREDLFYRLNVVPLRTPALRERLDDLPLLIEHFMQKKALKLKKTLPTLSSEALELLKKHNFPGNVRELENAIEYAMNLSGERNILLPEDMPDRIQSKADEKGKLNSHTSTSNLPSELLLEEAVNALEIDWIRRALKSSTGNISHAAKSLGLSRQGLHNKLAKYGIKE